MEVLQHMRGRNPSQDATHKALDPICEEQWLSARIDEGRRYGLFSVGKEITPALARMMLERNAGNRSLSKAFVRRYADDIKSGRWDARNGETIKVATTGEVIDGQHRLNAVIEANTPQQMVIMFGLDPKSRFTLDQGKARTVGDYLSMSGIPHPTTAAAVAQMLETLERYGKARWAIGSYRGVTKVQCVERAQSDPLVVRCVSEIPIKSAREYGSASNLPTAYYLTIKYRGEEEAASFYEAFVDQLFRSKNDPCYYAVHALRSKEWRAGKSNNQSIYLMLRAMQMRRTGQALKGNIPVNRPGGKEPSIWEALK